MRSDSAKRVLPYRVRKALILHSLVLGIQSSVTSRDTQSQEQRAKCTPESSRIALATVNASGRFPGRKDSQPLIQRDFFASCRKNRIRGARGGRTIFEVKMGGESTSGRHKRVECVIREDVGRVTTKENDVEEGGGEKQRGVRKSEKRA